MNPNPQFRVINRHGEVTFGNTRFFHEALTVRPGMRVRVAEVEMIPGVREGLLSVFEGDALICNAQRVQVDHAGFDLRATSFDALSKGRVERLHRAGL